VCRVFGTENVADWQLELIEELMKGKRILATGGSRETQRGE
jgi:hypothetical protein